MKEECVIYIEADLHYGMDCVCTETTVDGGTRFKF